MKISRFFGANSRDVMRQVRQVLGPDALIVSNRSVDGGIEVLATVDGAFDDAQQHAQEPAPRGYADGYARAAGTPAPQAQSAPVAPRLQPPPAMPASYGLGTHAAMAPPPHTAPIAPPAAPQPGYAVPSRSIAAYQSAYATPGVPEQEVLQEPVARQAPPAAVPPAAPVVAAPAPAAPVRVEMP
ncbi:flagellar biosynthesis protein FlhF, partial [Achromobacter xylosoxidans]|nr:flagellar biosynthesis protein FlhF [Achromobacter xylosoxidans]